MTLNDPRLNGTGIIEDRQRVADGWLAAARQPKTAAAYRADIEAFFAWCDRHGVDALRPARVELDRYRQHLAGRGYRPATRARKLAALSSFYAHGFLEFDALVPANPMARVRRPRVSRESTTASLDLDELRALISVAEQAGPRDAALVQVLAHTGVRVAELCNATVADLHTERGHRLLGVIRKGGEPGSVVIPASVAGALDRYLDGRNEGPLFIGSRGGPVSRHDVATALARLVREAGIDKPITPHSMRHTAAALSLDAGADVREIQRMLGHRNIETTMRYLQARERVERSPAHALARLIGGTGG